MTIPDGSRLTITPGTVVEFGPGEPAGSYRDKPNLIVYETLEARDVTFTSAEAGLDWGGLVVYGDTTNYTTNSVLTGCTIENASFGVRMRTVGWTVGGDAISEGNTFRNCTYGIYISGPGTIGSTSEDYGRNNVIRNNTFVDCPTGVLVAHAPGTTVRQNLVTDSDSYGIRVVGSGSSDALVVNNTLDARTGGGRGVYFSSASAGTLRSSIATGFPDGGASAGDTAILALDYYLGDDNGSDELSGTQDSTRRALLSAPKFTNTARSLYTLQADSPALDLGVPGTSGLPAEDGDRIDLGRFGGTAQAGTATGTLPIEEYFYKGQASGWTKASGTSGTWSGDRAQGTYKVTGANPKSRASKSVGASSYTLETRVKFTGAEGKILYMQADQNESYRIDLLAVNDRVRLMVNNAAQPGGSFTIDSNEWYHVRVEVKDRQVSVWVNGSLMHSNVSTEATPDGNVGLGSYGLGSHEAEFDYFLVMNAGGSSGGTPAPPGGSTFLVQDAFDDGSDSGWGVHSGAWSESGGLRKVVDLNGEGVSYLNTSFTSTHYTIKARLKMGSWEGKVVYRNADEGGGKRVDFMTNRNQVRVLGDLFSQTLNTNQWYVCEVEVNADDDKLHVWIDGQAANANVTMTGTPNGYVGLGSYGPRHTTEFDYLQVRQGARSAKALARMEVAAAPVALANFPNPFNPATTMRYGVEKNGAVKLVVYNVLGQAVRTLVDEVQEPGAHRVMWDGRDESGRQVVSGVYMYRLDRPGSVEVGKMMMLR